jgi:hypothetical protein
MELGIYEYIIPPEAITTACFIVRSISNTNTAASHIVEVITLILLEWLNGSSWNLVCTHMSRHLRPFIRRAS